MHEKTGEDTADDVVKRLRKKVKKQKQEKTSNERITSTFVTAICRFCSLLASPKHKLYEYQDPFQRGIVHSILINNGETLTALFSRQSGKTETIAQTVVGLAILLPKLARVPELVKFFPALEPFEEGFWVGLFAPIKDQAQTLFRRIKGLVSSKRAQEILMLPDILEEVETSNGTMIAMTGGSIIESNSASPTANIESKTYHLIVIDEGQDVESTKLNKSILPMGAATNASVVMAGTCNTVRSAFYEQIVLNKSLDHKVKRKWARHFENNYLIVQQYNTRYKNHIAMMKQKLGEDSDEFRMSYNLEWIFERGMFATLNMLKAKVLQPKYGIDAWEKFRGWSRIGAIDFGKASDSTVFTLGVANWAEPVRDERFVEGQAYKAAILDWLEISGDDWSSQYYQLAEAIVKHRLKKIVMDATGVGAGIVDRFRENFPDLEIEEFVFSLQAKSDGYKNFDSYMRRGLLMVPYNTETRRERSYKAFEAQMTQLLKEYKGQHMQCHAPDDIRGAKDDYPDSAMMFCHAAKNKANEGFEVIEESPFSPTRLVGRNAFLRG